MAGWFKRLFAGKTSAPLQAEHRPPLAQTKKPAAAPTLKSIPVEVAVAPARSPAPAPEQVFDQWRGKWHDYFDADPKLMAAGEFDRPDPLPDDIMSDYRLTCGISQATAATRKKCFALFPAGAEMHLRFDSYLTSAPVQMTQDEAQAGLSQIQALIEKSADGQSALFAAVRIVDRDTPEGLAALRSLAGIGELVEEAGLDVYSAEDPAIRSAAGFLSEPMYMSCGNWFQLGDWVCAAMVGGDTDALGSTLYKMWDGGWQVMFDDDGMVLVRRKVGR